MPLKNIKISARSSQLAKLQAYLVGDELLKHYPNLNIKYEFRESLGDKNLTDPLWKMPEKGVFTEDFYRDLVDGHTDMVVHSWKDLPVESKEDTFISATLPRADQRDILIFKKNSVEKKTLKLFTSSPRREYNLKPFLISALPNQTDDIQFAHVRGNVPTRLRKLFADETIDGLILAKAAVDRFLLSQVEEFKDVQKEIKSYFLDNLWMVLPLSINPNAAAQGALAIEIKNDRQDIHKMLTAIHCEKTFKSAQLERKTLKKYGGGCHQKIGVTHLFRPYGEIIFLQGKTDQGVVLNEKKLTPQFDVNRIEHSFLRKWSSSSLKKMTIKTDIQFKLPENINGLFVSQASAWSNVGFKSIKKNHDMYIWTAGLETWKKLAAQGVWVNGSAEGLGEKEDKRIDHLANQIVWTKLTHDQVLDKTHSTLTYKLKLNLSEDDMQNLEFQINSTEIIFWTSPFYFSEMYKLFPQILDKKHACGVGLTHDYLVQYHNIEPYLFLNEQEFLKI